MRESGIDKCFAYQLLAVGYRGARCFADESSASIFNFGTPLQSNYAFILVIILGYRNSYRIFGQTVLDIFAPLNHEHPAHIEIIKNPVE